MGKWEDRLNDKGKLNILNEKDALSAVNEDARYIKHIPKNLITAAVVGVCVKDGRFAEVLEYAPPEAFPKDFTDKCLEAIRICRINDKARSFNDRIDAPKLNDYDFVVRLNGLPPALWTPEVSRVCLEALGARGTAVRGIPPERLTEKMCLTAVNNDYRALENIPDNLKTEKMCLWAVNKSEAKNEFWRTLKFVPKNCLPEEIHEKLLYKIKNEKNALGGDLLSLVPEHLRTEDICIAAIRIRTDWFSILNNIPKHLRTDAVQAAADEAVKKIKERDRAKRCEGGKLPTDEEAVAEEKAEYPDSPEATYKKMMEESAHLPDALRKMMVKANMSRLFPDFAVPDDDE